MLKYMEKNEDGSFLPKIANYRSPRYYADIPEDIDRKYYDYLQVEEVVKTNDTTGLKYIEKRVFITPEGIAAAEKRIKKGMIDQAKLNLKAERVRILKETDTAMIVPDYPISAEDKERLKEYRNYVRHVNDTLEDEQLLDFKLPSFEEWKDKK